VRLVGAFYYYLMKKLAHLFATKVQNALVLHLGFMYRIVWAESRFYFILICL
jgi:hypothetical protein